MEIRNDHNWKEDIPAFREKTAAFYAGELSKDAYKGFSPDCTEATRRRAERQACCVCA